MFYRKFLKKNIKYVLKNYGMLTSTLRTQQSRYALFICVQIKTSTFVLLHNS